MNVDFGPNNLLVVEPDLLDSEMLFSRFCTLGLLYTCSPTLGFGGEAPEKFVLDACWPTVLRTHGIGLTVVFSHGISPIKRKHCNMVVYGIVLYCSIVNNLCDCERETVRERRGSVSVLLQVVSLHLSGR